MGHIADGNLHFFVHPRHAGTTQAECDEIVYSPLRKYGGSISAEHGIGHDKKPWLVRSRSADELLLMHHLKRMLDPQGILNPGCVIDP
jgi:FAD/FMN-containing dehydrogenase